MFRIRRHVVNHRFDAYIWIMQLDLTDEEQEALARHLRQHIRQARYPLAPALDPLKSILEKLDPTQPKSEPMPVRTYEPPRISPKQRRPRSGR